MNPMLSPAARPQEPSRRPAANDAAAEEPKRPTVAEVMAKVIQKAEPGTEPETLAGLALRALERELGKGYRDLRTRIMSEWAAEQLRYARSRGRANIIALHSRTADAPPAPGRDRTASVLTAMFRAWFDWPLENTPLGEATKPQLLAEADRYRKVARASQARADWLAAIADALPDDSATVSKTLTEVQVAGMAQQFGVVNDQGGV